jgi:hypothetical protein
MPPSAPPPPVSAPQVPDERAKTVTAYVDTQLVDPRYRSAVRARISKINLEDLSTIELRTRDGIDLLSLPRHEPVQVVLVLPPDLDKGDEDAFTAAVEKSINRRFDRPVFSIRRSYMPESVVQSINSEANAPDYENWKQWVGRIAKEVHDGSYEPEKVDLFFGSLIGQARTFGSGGYWLTVTGWNRYGATQAILAMAISHFFSLFPTQINTWKVEHQIPIFQEDPLVQFYNDHPYVKTVVINELTALSMQVVFRFFSYLAQPAKIASPFSSEFLAPFFGMSFVRAPLGAAEDLGVLKLLKKGYIDRRTAHYMSNVFGVQSFVSGLLFGAGKMRWLPLALGLEWSAKLAVWVASAVLPAKNNRLIIVHPKVSGRDLDQVEYTYDLRRLPLDKDKISSSQLHDLLSDYVLPGPKDQPKLSITTSELEN